MHLLLTWGPRQGTTADAVARVAQAKTQSPKKYDALFAQIEANTQLGLVALQSGDLISLGSTLDVNHKLLRELEVVTPALDQACVNLKNLGALGAKMSGAGMGGTSFGLFVSQAEALKATQALKSQGCQAWQVSI